MNLKPLDVAALLQSPRPEISRGCWLCWHLSLVCLAGEGPCWRQRLKPPKMGAKHGGLCIWAGWELVAPCGSQSCSLMLWLRTKPLHKQQLRGVERLDEPGRAGSVFLGRFLHAWLSTLILVQRYLMLLPYLCRSLPWHRDGYSHACSVGRQSVLAVTPVGALSKERQMLWIGWLGDRFVSTATVQYKRYLCILSEKQLLWLWTKYIPLSLNGTFRNARSVEKCFCNRCVIFIFFFFYSNLLIFKLVH